jgi:hypothetical protein
VAKHVSTAVNGVRIDEDVGANDATHLVIQPLRQPGARFRRIDREDGVSTFKTLEQGIAKRETSAPRFS